MYNVYVIVIIGVNTFIYLQYYNIKRVMEYGWYNYFIINTMYDVVLLYNIAVLMYYALNI